jgi:tRNA-dihydrouridine synthase
VNLLFRIERHLRRTGEPPTVLGRKALGDPNLVRNLRNGRELRPPTRERLCRYLADTEARQA